jgi:hypothetical protein
VAKLAIRVIPDHLEVMARKVYKAHPEIRAKTVLVGQEALTTTIQAA